MTPAHQQTETLRFIQLYPEHEPRASDPHYSLFNAARNRLEKLGALKCWIGNADCQGGIELHHSQIEYALANDVDVSRFAALHPELLVSTDEEFLAFVEGEGNLMPLCLTHHRGVLGVHSIHYPAWIVQRYLKAGVGAPERVDHASASPP